VFQFDDFANILEDPRLVSLAGFCRNLDQMIRPVTRLTFLIDRQVFAEDPAGYHILNILLHLGCGTLIFMTLRASLNCLKRARPTFSVSSQESIPFWTALLFLIHPIGTETVTYLSGRATGLMTFFYLASLYLFIRSAERRGEETFKFLTTYLGALTCFVLALLSKEVALTLPVALLLWEFVFQRQGENPEQYPGARLHSPFWGVAALFLLAAGIHPRYQYLLRASFGLRPLWENCVTQINTVAYAAGLFFSPARLNFDHDRPAYHSLLEWPTPLSLLILLGLLAAGLLLVRKMPFLSFGLLWFFLQILPTNGLLPRYDVLSERNLYLPSVGLFLAFVFLWKSAAERLGEALRAHEGLSTRAGPTVWRMVGSLPVVWSLLLLSCTVERNAIYGNEVAFWLDVVHKSPGKARPRNNLGYAYFQAGDVDHAIREFHVASQLDPAFSTARENLAKATSLRNSHTVP
jgi:tetratricopeptide (TPR) repeat protein